MLNSIFGTKFYGRDETGQKEGAYIATQWLVVFFIPVFPLGSFRVQPKDSLTAATSPVSQCDVVQKVPWQWQHIVNVYAFITAIAILAYLTNYYRKVLTEPAPVSPIASETRPPKIVAPAYKRADVDENGIPFPENSGFMDGYPQAFTDGGTQLTVDNTGNDKDIYVKLYNLDVAPPGIASVFFIQGQDKLTVETITPGTYELRYSVLDTGDFFRTSFFTLEETLDEERNLLLQTHLTLQLSGSISGNMKLYPITEEDFSENTILPQEGVEGPVERKPSVENKQTI